MDSRLRAYDTTTGRELWQADLPAPGMSVPATYEADGEQYVAIAATGDTMFGTELSDKMVAFKLPR